MAAAAGACDASWEAAGQLLSTPLRCLRALGLWAPPRRAGAVDARGRLWRGLYAAYSVANLALVASFLLSTAFNLKTSRRDLSEFTESLTFCTVTINNFAKVWPLLLGRERVLRCLRTLDRLLRAGGVAERARPSAGERLSALRRLRARLRRGTLTWVGAAAMALSGHLSFPLLSGAMQHVPAECAGADGPGALASTPRPECAPRRLWRLPFSAWYPFEFQSGGGGFWCAWALQLVSGGFDALDTASSNSFYLSLMFCACVCMRTLSHDLREAPANDAARMRELVWRHQTALRFAEEISSIIGPIMFVQSIGTSLMLCAAVLNLTLTELNSTKFLGAVVFLVFEMSELYLYCLFGTEIQIESEACGDAAYASPWFEAPSRAQRSLLLLLLRAQKPASVRGFGYMTVSLPLFVGLLRLSYSYYALLSQVDD